MEEFKIQRWYLQHMLPILNSAIWISFGKRIMCPASHHQVTYDHISTYIQKYTNSLTRITRFAAKLYANTTNLQARHFEAIIWCSGILTKFKLQKHGTHDFWMIYWYSSTTKWLIDQKWSNFTVEKSWISTQHCIHCLHFLQIWIDKILWKKKNKRFPPETLNNRKISISCLPFLCFSSTSVWKWK